VTETLSRFMQDGYDLSLGTSERGECVDSYEPPEFKYVSLRFSVRFGNEFFKELLE
jgi:hypothetical protein